MAGVLNRTTTNLSRVRRRVKKCGLPSRRNPDHVARRFADSLVLSGFQVDVGDWNQQLRARFLGRWKRIARKQLNVAHRDRAQRNRVHEPGVRIDRRADGGGPIVQPAGVGLVAVVRHFRIEEFDGEVAIFDGAVVADAQRPSAGVEAHVALVKVKIDNVRFAFRPDHHIGIEQRDHQEVAIVPRHGPFQRPQRERKHTHLIVGQQLPVMRRRGHVGRALRPRQGRAQQQHHKTGLHVGIVFRKAGRANISGGCRPSSAADR